MVSQFYDAYQQTLANSSLSCASKLRLDFAIKQALHYEEVNDLDKAIEIAEEALQKSPAAMSDLTDKELRYAKSCLGLLNEDLNFYREYREK